MQPCSLDEYVYVGALGLPEGLHATLRPIHREILMINMSSGEQENGHTALEPFHRGRGFEISDYKKRARKHVFSDGG